MDQHISIDEHVTGNIADAGLDQADTSRDFEDALLAALAGMAVHSHRRQADVFVAVRRAGLLAGPDRVRTSLRHLQLEGCLERLVPLSDGGVLVSLTGRGIERISQSTRRHVVGGA
jgi:hypothetical protein